MKMLSTFTLFFFAFFIHAQDIVTFQNGDEIEVIVKEIGIDEIKYVRFDNPDGPIYSILKSDVFMIKYSNGSKDVFKSSDSENKSKNENSNSKESDDTNYKQLSYKKVLFGRRYYHGDDKIDKSEFVQILKTDSEAYSHYSGIGGVMALKRFFSAGSWVGTILCLKFSLDDETAASVTSGVLGLLSGVIGTFLGKKARSKLELAVLTFNENLR